LLTKLYFLSSEANNKPNNPPVSFDLSTVSSFSAGVSAEAIGILCAPVYYFGILLRQPNWFVNMKRKFKLAVVFDEIVGKAFTNPDDKRRDLMGRNVPKHMTTTPQGQLMFYFLRVCICAILTDSIIDLLANEDFSKVCIALLESTVDAEDREVRTKGLITVDGKHTFVYDRRGMYTCYTHKFIEKLHSASLHGRR
jgi:hypothetical protein